MAEPEPTEEEIAEAEAFLAKQEASGDKLANLPMIPEVMPAIERHEWSPHDPGAMDLYIHACIKASRDKIAEPFEAGRIACGCPADVAAAYRADPRFTTRFQQLTHETIYLANLPAAMESAMQDGGAYGVAQMRQAAPKDDLTDDEKRRASAFARMTPAELVKEIERHEKIMLGFKEKLLAGRAPAPARVRELAEAAVGPMGEPQRGPSATEAT